MQLTSEFVLPDDAARALLLGRAWIPGPLAGPSPIVVRDGVAYDLSHVAATVADIVALDDVAGRIRAALAHAKPVATLPDLLANSVEPDRDGAKPWLLAPCDLQAIRACGVTFVASMLERVIEEHANGDPAQAEAIRRSLGDAIGASLSSVKPGSAEAMRVKALLQEQGLWSQYLEVGIGPDAEVFNKAQPLSAVGIGADVGVLEASSWNNPEPEVVLAVDPGGHVVGASLGNDVNLRDFEGRSALLLGRAKDNNASCAIGPFIRLFDADFGIDDLRRTVITTTVRHPDGFAVEGSYALSQISRDPLDLASQAIGPHHQYPDGLMLFLGTAFAPTQDRGEPGRGFTHASGDVVSIRSSHLGALVNRVGHCHSIPPWTFGVSALMRNLAARGLL